jgi:hypothetical protein
MITATRPLEYICLYQIEYPTRDKGDVYMFAAVDVFSEFLFVTGTEESNNDQLILKHVKLLLNDKNFKQHSNSFTLVFHKHSELKKDIEAIIKPLGGNMIVDDPLVAKVFTPVIEHIFKSFANPH